MKILVSGSSGFVGAAVVLALTRQGHDVRRLVRREPRTDTEIGWDPEAGRLDAALLEGFDGVVSLAGENVAGRWTAPKKARIRDSRVRGTRLLAETLARLKSPPRVLVSASAVGCYGSRGEEVLTEESGPGAGFLAQVCREWEAAADAAARTGLRVAKLRLGVVLDPSGGALKQMLLPFRLGLGGPIGDGRQYMSWISLEDAAGVFQAALEKDPFSGVINAVAPEPVTNAAFTKALGRALSRPTVFPLPAFAARLALGQMAEEMLLSSARVVPARLKSLGYAFRRPTLASALESFRF